MKRVSFFSLLFCLSYASLAQDLTFNKDIAPIIHTNCTPCHRPREVGPFSLITYEDVAKRSKFIRHVTQTRYMPPWKADPEFQHYQNERLLTQQEIDLIARWIDSGVPEGKKRNKPSSPEFQQNSQMRADPDLVLTMREPFDIPPTATEEFRFFSLPTKLPEDVYLKAIEFRPGNRQYVHHSRVMLDTTNLIRGIDGLSELDPKVQEFYKIPLAEEFLYGWVPGNMPFIYPENTGKLLKKNSDLILNIHYAPSGNKAQDQSGINLYFTDELVEQEVQIMTLRENDITNQPFFLEAESQPTFYMRSAPLAQSIDVISVLPHMHTLGKTFRAFAITPAGDLVPFVKIDDWDFNWQSTYVFEELLNVPAGSVIYAEATYDNTINNPENPNYPPEDVTYGWNTTDEMMNFIIYYVDAEDKGTVKK
ncbi:hypothetical protein OKW21_004695 [Catalinimonas alkaloidigena]|uniref:monooxygenase n=1 Tax=Catalinimonas alkaloidigena TaxID=1075417 RepID=UPI002404BBB3|nr:hypothetical protein [Catalinimonas alkaloidigena]MDF9799432.1 hypothetical protein [Catalinimonas alkaloidigena]